MHFRSNPINPPSNTQQDQQHPEIQSRSGPPFTYVGKETSYITNLFKKTEPRIAFRTTSTIRKLLSHKNPTPDKFSLSGVYRLTCPDCNKAYVGQTGRRFATRFKEHEKAFRSNSHTPSSRNTLMRKHTHSAPWTASCKYCITEKKGAHVNTLERFQIHTEFAANNHLKENQTVYPKAIFDTLVKTHRP